MRRALAVARASLAAERSAPKRPTRARAETAFLPAALEIVETPAAPAARATIWLLALLFAIALAWAWVGCIDVVAVAEGKIVPSGRVKVIQPLEIGAVRRILVEDGMAVRRGDVLIELDPTTSGADRARLEHELTAARLDAARSRAVLAGTASPGAAAVDLVAPDDVDPALLATERRRAASEIEEHEARLRGLGDEARRRRAERAATQATLTRIDKALPLLRERAAARGELAEKGYGSRLLFLEVQQTLVEHEQERVVMRHRLHEADAAIAALESQRTQAAAEFRRLKLAELAEAERRAASLGQELRKAELRHALQTLSAPIDGVVQQLAIHTVGGVVTPAQPLMVIVPEGEALEVEAMVANKDIGFVRPGQAAEVKLETFLFTRYGTIPATVVSVSGDAIADDKRGLVYAARLELARTAMEIDGRAVRLAPGMSASAEIKTDRRRLLEYLVSPILRYTREAARER